MKILYLFTEYYPTGSTALSEHAFVQHEFEYLRRQFDIIKVIPSVLINTNSTLEDKFVDFSLARRLMKKGKILFFIKAITSKFFYKEIVRKRVTFWSVKKIKKLIYFTARTEMVKNWSLSSSKISNTIDSELLYYTFWTNEITLGLSSIDNRTIITRAHGHDLHQEQHGYIPCYKDILSKVKKMYLVSQPAIDYLMTNYPEFLSKYYKRYLGVKEANKTTTYSIDNSVRIVSCSYICKRKRVESIVLGISEFIRKYKIKVIWTHFGGGDENFQLIKLAESFKNDLFNFTFMGNHPNNEILLYYNINPIDIFILTSKYEGGVPVALQEAQAHGIPVIGTQVGGVPEIVNDKVGVLISENPSDEEIADAIYSIIVDKKHFLTLRKNSVENWRNHFNEQKNCQEFAKEIYNLI